MPDIWGIAGIEAKFCLYLWVLGAAGTVFAAVSLGRDLGPWLGIAATSATLGLGAAVVGFALRGAAMTGDASGLTDPEMLGLLWQTPVGSALTWRVLGLRLLIVGLVLNWIGPWISAVGGALAVWSFDHVGHVQDRDLIWMDAALTLHLLGVALWIGVMTPLRR